jgi:hypothetical protein
LNSRKILLKRVGIVKNKKVETAGGPYCKYKFKADVRSDFDLMFMFLVRYIERE